MYAGVVVPIPIFLAAVSVLFTVTADTVCVFAIMFVKTAVAALTVCNVALIDVSELVTIVPVTRDVPVTSRLYAGLLVPIPTLPENHPDPLKL